MLLPYRTKEPFTRMALIISHPERQGESHVVEVLGKGRQYLVYGRHPKGMDYEWDLPLWDVKPSMLNEISVKLVNLFFNSVKRALVPKGFEVEVVGDGATKEQRSPEQEDLWAPSLEDLEKCVRAIPNSSKLWPDRDDYILMGHAIKAAGAQWPGDTYELWQWWCSQWEGDDDKNPDGNDPAVVERDWNKMQPPYRVGWSWLCEQASQCAADYAAPVDEFEADPDWQPNHEPALSVHGPAESAAYRTVNLSDIWIRDEVHEMLNGMLMYSTSRGAWHVWNGHKWEIDDTSQAEGLIAEAHIKLSQPYVLAAENAPTVAEAQVCEGQRKAAAV